MEIVTTEEFKKSVAKLPKDIERLWRTQQRRFTTNWRDPRLHLKKLRDIAGIFSVRITRRYRAFFYFSSEEMAIFFEIDHRKDAYR